MRAQNELKDFLQTSITGIRYRRLFMVKVAAVALALMLSPARGLAKPAKPLWTHRPASGYIDDALAFSDDGRHLAFIHTDAATFLKVVVLDTTTFRTLKRIAVRGATKIPRQLVFNANASRIILVWIDSSTSRQGAMLFDTRSGKLLKKVGFSMKGPPYSGQNVSQLPHSLQ